MVLLIRLLSFPSRPFSSPLFHHLVVSTTLKSRLQIFIDFLLFFFIIFFLFCFFHYHLSSFAFFLFPSTAKQLQFESKRKQHYNEAMFMKRAKQLIADEFDDEDEDEEEGGEITSEEVQEDQEK